MGAYRAQSPRGPSETLLAPPDSSRELVRLPKGHGHVVLPADRPGTSFTCTNGECSHLLASVRPHGPIPDRVDQGGAEGDTKKSGIVALRRRATLFTGQEVKENTCARIPCENGAAKPPRWAPVAPGGVLAIGRDMAGNEPFHAAVSKKRVAGKIFPILGGPKTGSAPFLPPPDPGVFTRPRVRVYTDKKVKKSPHT